MKKTKKKTTKTKTISTVKKGFFTCDSLTTFKRRLEEQTNEKVKSFIGYELLTNKAKYTLQFGEVIRTSL